MNQLSRFISDESGVTAIEYALIAALVAVVIVPAVTGLGAAITAKFQTVTTALR